MVIHSDSNLGAVLGFMIVFASFTAVSISAVLCLSGRSRRALITFLASAAMIGTYTLAVIAASLLSPGKIVNIGDSYCEDLWCIGVTGVSHQPLGRETLYKLDVRIFSDANRVPTSAKGASLYLMDEHGRRFPLVDDRAAVPYYVTLNPGQSIRTSLTFVAAADARQLFLTGDAGPPPFWGKLYFGSDDSLLHKRTLLRVL